jgi:excisionase family DNA binding protein
MVFRGCFASSRTTDADTQLWCWVCQVQYCGKKGAPAGSAGEGLFLDGPAQFAGCPFTAETSARPTVQLMGKTTLKSGAPGRGVRQFISQCGRPLVAQIGSPTTRFACPLSAVERSPVLRRSYPSRDVLVVLKPRAVSHRFRDFAGGAGGPRSSCMNEDACRSGRRRATTRDQTSEPPTLLERAGRLPAWAFQTHQNADADELRRRHYAIEVAASPPLRSATPTLLMTVKDAAALLRVSTKTVRRLVERGELQVVRIGRSVRLRKSDVLEIIEQGQ